MQEKDAHEEWVARLSSLMKMSSVSTHRHVFDRLGTLLGHDRVVWVDGRLKDENMMVSGRMAVFTETVVAIVTLRDEMRGGGGALGFDPRGTTDVVVLPRRSLTEVRLPGGEPADRINEAYTWARVTPDGRPNNTGWPSTHSGAPVDLVYGDVVVEVHREIGAGMEGMGDFMATVMRDLALS